MIDMRYENGENTIRILDTDLKKSIVPRRLKLNLSKVLFIAIYKSPDDLTSIHICYRDLKIKKYYTHILESELCSMLYQEDFHIQDLGGITVAVNPDYSDSLERNTLVYQFNDEEVEIDIKLRLR